MTQDLFEKVDNLPAEDPHAEEGAKVATTKPKKKDNRGRKKGSVIEAPLVSYTGPLTIFLQNEFKFPEGYDPLILDFKTFIDGLGASGVTFEHLFAEADKAFSEGKIEAEVSKIKQKLSSINSKNVLTFKTIKLICGLLGYEPVLNFQKKNVETLNLEEEEITLLETD